ncbi:MAG: oligosaccharide flippase family protein [Firmicutes bacterium]|nr:oligosaccharide flippase family protein [Bacillota bacterium]MCL2770795.1 oligosaccharide flippase family protein [Bacillota bacterium]
MSIRHLFKSVMLIMVFMALTKIFGFVFRIFLSHQLGAEVLGYYQLAFSVFMVFITLTTSGLTVTLSRFTAEVGGVVPNAPRRVAEDSDPYSRAHTYVSAALIVGMFLCVVSTVIMLLFKPVFMNIFDNNELSYQIIITLIPAIFFSCFYSIFRGYLWGKKNFFAVGITELFEQAARVLIAVIIIFIFFSSAPPEHKAIWSSISLSIACIMSAVYSAILYWRAGGRLKNPKSAFLPLLKSAGPVTALRLIGSLSIPLLSFIIPLRLMAVGFTESEAMASLGIVMGMVFPLLLFPSAITSSLAMALIPDISSNLGDKAKTREKCVSAISFVLIFSFLLLPLFIAVGEPIGIVLFNNKEAGQLVAQIAWVMVPMGIAAITSSILNSLGKEAWGFVNGLISSVFLLIAIWFLPQVLGIGALGLGFGVMATVGSVLNLILIDKELKIKGGESLVNIKTFLLLTIFTILTGAIGRLTYNLFGGVSAVFIPGLIGGTVSLLCFGVLLVAFGIIKPKFVVVSFFGVFRKVQKRSY